MDGRPLEATRPQLGSARLTSFRVIKHLLYTITSTPYIPLHIFYLYHIGEPAILF